MHAADVGVRGGGGPDTAQDGVARLQPKHSHLATSHMALRTATHDIHERMHHHPGLARLAAGTISQDEYRGLLARSYGFYIMAEPVAGLPGKFTDCLVQDLADLGMAATVVSGLSRCPPLMIGQGHAEVTGASYVLLGASLGGKVMAKAIANRSGGDAPLPVRFLTSLGKNEWKSFAAGLEANLPDAASRTQAAKAATATFAAYEDWMAGHE